MSRAHHHRRRSRSRNLEGLRKGAYRLPTGGYVTESVGLPNKRGRRIRIVAVHRQEPDPKKIADALIAIILERQHDQSED
jgi:hypothetical protein